MKKFPWRGILYAVMMLYLLVDLKLCHGPLRQAMMSRRDASVAAALENKWVAIINLEAVTREQLDLAVLRHLYQRGKTPEGIPEKNLAMIRRAVLQSLIDETLVRQYADGEKFVAPEEEIERFVRSWESQFPSPEDKAAREEKQRLNEASIRGELARIWSRKRWLEKRISPAVAVTDEEVKTWFEANRENPEGGFREGFVEPEKVRARHLFLRTEPVDDKGREDLIREIHRKLTSGESTFDALARAHSEDERTKDKGGDLNWFSRGRLPGDFTAPVFSLAVGETSEPFKTRFGWHIVEILEKQSERPVTYEEVAGEIRSHLESQRTEETVKVLMQKLRRVANIQLFPENI